MTPIDPFFLQQYAGDDDGDAGSNDSGQPCPDCGYDLRGMPRSRPCPECGWADEQAPLDPGAPLPAGAPCRKCGTVVPGMAIGSLCPDCAMSGHRERVRPPECAACGYDLTGLAHGARCPECGEAPSTSSLSVLRPVALPTMPMHVLCSLRWQSGLLLLTSVGFGWFLLVILRTFGVLNNNAWSLVLLLVAVALVAVCWLVTPASVDGKAPWMRPMRWAARVCIIGLPVATEVEQLWSEIVFGLIGLVGLALLLWILAMLARVSDAMQTSRRFELGWILCLPLGALTWLLPVPGVIVSMPANEVGYIRMFLLIVMFIPTAVLCWYVFRPALTMFQEAQWARHNAVEQAQQDAKRSQGGTCSKCGCSLHGLMSHAPCPQCGAAS